jgi:putative acyl-CoA dehydrogenase
MKSEQFAAQDPEAVLNQPPALEGHDPLEMDLALKEGMTREGGAFIAQRAEALSKQVGDARTHKLAALANRYVPVLRSHDRFGHRIDEVEFHPAYHELMRMGIEAGCHALPWIENRPGAHVARAVLYILRAQAEEGTGCPITMTFAVVPSLRLQPDVAAEWVPRVLTTTYDERFIPAEQKRGVTFGMAMTERQGGSDVRANTTRARPLGAGGPGGEYEILGHKWFCSAPMSDAFLTLARTDKGLSCFLLPRWRPDGTRNGFHINRLKDKMGNLSNASSEVEFRNAWARMIGEDGRGVSTIIEMVRHTRLDCVFGSTGSMRHAFSQAAHHATHRWAFGRKLMDQPLMRNVLADLAIESEAATSLALRLAHWFDDAAHDPRSARLARIATAIAKYWVTKRNPPFVSEALECIGGNGFIDESPMPRLYRDSPINSLWEGTGNVQCLDALRAMHKDPEALEILVDELRRRKGVNAHYDRHLRRVETELVDSDHLELRARRIVEWLALALQGALLLEHGAPCVADAFCASRLAGDQGLAFGTLPVACDLKGILSRAWPAS